MIAQTTPLCSRWADAPIASGTSGVHRPEPHYHPETSKAALSKPASRFLREPCCRWGWTIGARRPSPTARAETTTKPEPATGIFLLTNGKKPPSPISAGRNFSRQQQESRRDSRPGCPVERSSTASECASASDRVSTFLADQISSLGEISELPLGTPGKGMASSRPAELCSAGQPGAAVPTWVW